MSNAKLKPKFSKKLKLKLNFQSDFVSRFNRDQIKRKKNIFLNKSNSIESEIFIHEIRTEPNRIQPSNCFLCLVLIRRRKHKQKRARTKKIAKSVNCRRNGHGRKQLEKIVRKLFKKIVRKHC